MSEQFWLSDEQVERLAPYFPRLRGRARVDDRRMLSGITHVQRNGVFASLAEEAGPPERIIIDDRRLRAHRTVASLLQKKGVAAHRAHQRWPEL